MACRCRRENVRTPLLPASKEQKTKENKHTGLVRTVIPRKRYPVADQLLNLYLFGQKAVHDEDECSLQAVEDGEDILYSNGVLFKQEASEHPHQAQNTCLGYGRHCESPGEEREDSEGGDKELKNTDN